MKIAFIIVKVLLTALIGFAAFSHITLPAPMQENLAAIKFPLYIMPFLGVCKLLALVAIWLPGYRDAKLASYTCLFFYSIAAFIAHASNGHGPDKIMGSIIMFILVVSNILLWIKTSSPKLSVFSKV